MKDQQCTLTRLTFFRRAKTLFADGSLLAATAVLLCVICNPGYAQTHQFEPSGLDGGGFQSVVAINPFDPSVVISGADTSGFQRSTNAGNSWQLSNQGLTEKQKLVVASVVFSNTVRDKVYAGVGKFGASGGLLVSLDGGQSWQVRSSAPQFAGGNTDFMSAPHPRSTGNLIALDEASDYIYVGTYKNGVMRCRNDGRDCVTIGLSNQTNPLYIRSIALNPSNPQELFAAVYGKGVYRTTIARTASGTSNWKRITGIAPFIEELRYIGNQLYAVGDDDTAAKVYKISATTWVQLLSTPSECSPVTPDCKTSWISIDGYVVPSTGKHVLFIGSVKPPLSVTGSYKSIMRSDDSGLNWNSITDPASINNNIGGPDGDEWWLAKFEEATKLGGERYVANYIAVAPDQQTIYVAGRSGVWRTTDSGADWYPVVRQMNTTFNRDVAVDPNSPWRVYLATTDWTFLYSTDRMSHVEANDPGPTIIGNNIAVDRVTSKVYLAVGDGETNTLGNVYSSSDPTVLGWNTEDPNDALKPRVLGVTVRTVGGTTTLLAAVDGDGVWRKVNNESWSRKGYPNQGLMQAQPVKTVSFSWVPNTAVIYLFDRNSGVWRSNNPADPGSSWKQIWNTSSPEDTTGYLAADPTDPSMLYVSKGDGLYRLDNADTGTVADGSITVTELDVPDPGPLALDGVGNLYVTSRMLPNTLAGLYRSGNNGDTFINVADLFYKYNAGFPLSMAVDDIGKVYVTLFGQGVVVGTPIP